MAGPTTHAAGGRPARQQRYIRRQQTMTTDDSEQNNTGPLGGPVINRSKRFLQEWLYRERPGVPNAGISNVSNAVNAEQAYN